MLPKRPDDSNTPDSSKPQTEFEKLMAEEKADKARQDQALKRQRGDNSRNRKVLLGVGAGVTALIVAGLVIYDPTSGALRFGEKETHQVAAGKGEGTDTQKNGNVAGQPQNWWEEPANKYPVELQPWQQQTFNPKNATEVYASVDAAYTGTMLESASNQLPSQSTGFTNDPKQETVDGRLNPLFSYWTQEDFEAETGTMLERLINPTFGGWQADSNAGRMTDGSYKKLSDLFSKTWQEAHPNASDIPVFLGAGKSVDYLPSGGSRWIGQVKDMTTDFQYDESIRNYRVTLVADISYTTWTQSKQKTTQTVELTLNLVPNQNEYANGSANRVVIDSGTIEVKS